MGKAFVADIKIEAPVYLFGDKNKKIYRIPEIRGDILLWEIRHLFRLGACHAFRISSEEEKTNASSSLIFDGGVLARIPPPP